jgi:hypothetical protein
MVILVILSLQTLQDVEVRFRALVCILLFLPLVLSSALQIRVPTGLSVRIKSRDVTVEFQKQVSWFVFLAIAKVTMHCPSMSST